MVTIHEPPTPSLPSSLVLRALEVARDPGVSLEDAAEHLTRLAKGSARPLQLAVALLERRGGGSPVYEHARLILGMAVEQIAPSRRTADVRSPHSGAGLPAK